MMGSPFPQLTACRASCRSSPFCCVLVFRVPNRQPGTACVRWHVLSVFCTEYCTMGAIRPVRIWYQLRNSSWPSILGSSRQSKHCAEQKQKKSRTSLHRCPIWRIGASSTHATMEGSAVSKLGPGYDLMMVQYCIVVLVVVVVVVVYCSIAPSFPGMHGHDIGINSGNNLQ